MSRPLRAGAGWTPSGIAEDANGGRVGADVRRPEKSLQTSEFPKGVAVECERGLESFPEGRTGIRLLSVAEAAELLRVPRGTLQNWIYQKRYPGLKSIKLGRHRRLLEEDLLKFIRSRREETRRERAAGAAEMESNSYSKAFGV